MLSLKLGRFTTVELFILFSATMGRYLRQGPKNLRYVLRSQKPTQNATTLRYHESVAHKAMANTQWICLDLMEHPWFTMRRFETHRHLVSRPRRRFGTHARLVSIGRM